MTENEIFHGRYELIKKLGSGAFAEVWLVRDTQAGIERALKIYATVGGLAEDGIEVLRREFALVADVTHQNLLTPKHFATFNNQPYLVMQLCLRGSLQSCVGHFTERQAWQLLRDAASGLAYLHAMTPPIIHQDIKPGNILESDNGLYMLTDFGISTKAIAKATGLAAAMQSAGTTGYMGPERFSKNPQPIKASDIWSLGATVFELVAGFRPFGNDGGLLQKRGADLPDLPGQFSQKLAQVLAQCLDHEPSNRPKAEHLEEVARQALLNLPTLGAQVENDVELAPEPVSAPQPAPQPSPSSHSQAPTQMFNPSDFIPSTEPEPAPSAEPEPVSEPQPSSDQQRDIDKDFKPVAEPVGKKTPWPIIAGSVAAVLALGVGGFFLFSSPSEPTEMPQPVSPEQELVMQELQLPDEPVVEDNMAVADTTAVLNSEEAVADATDIDSLKKANAPKDKPDVDNLGIATVQLPYASYTGEVNSAGKPHGSGTLFFTKKYTLTKDLVAEKGDVVVGAEFSDGKLIQGKYQDKQGTLRSFVISE